MAAAPKYTEAQLTFIRKQYMKQRGQAKAIAVLVNAEFPELNVSVNQIHNVVRDRGWAKLRKKAQAGVPTLEQAIVEVQANRALAIKDIVDGHMNVGAAIVKKAAGFVDSATSAKTLSSAASAAKTGISIIRDALGLGSHTSVSHTTLEFNFAHGPGSPFRQDRAQVVEVEAEAVAT